MANSDYYDMSRKVCYGFQALSCCLCSVCARETRKLWEADGQTRGNREVERSAELCLGHLQAGHHLLHPARRDTKLVSKKCFPWPDVDVFDKPAISI